MDLLKQRVLDNTFQDMRRQIQGITPQDMEATRRMLHDLNEMLRDRMQGREPDFQGFMDRYGDLFGPDRPQNLDELMEQLQRRMGQAQSLMRQHVSGDAPRSCRNSWRARWTLRP